MDDNILQSIEPEVDPLGHMDLSVSMATLPTDVPVEVPTDATPSTPVEESEVNMDEYMARFEKIQSRNETGKQLLAQLLKIKHASGPLVGIVIDCVELLQAQNDEMYSLLVDMNNLFGN